MSRNRDDDRDAIDEQWDGLPATARRVGTSAIEEGECPPQFRPWLRAVHQQYLLEQSPTTEEFLADVARRGLVRAVLSNVDEDDLDGKDRRRGYFHRNLLPNLWVVPGVIRYALEFEDDPHWRGIAAKWLPEYVVADSRVGLLTGVMARASGVDSHHAAVHLADLAPGTPGLAERLLDAACECWSVSRAAAYDGVSGADRAFELLARCGTPEFLPQLLAALAANQCRAEFGATELYLKWGGDAAELVRRSWDAPPDGPERLVAVLQALPADTAGLVERLAALAAVAPGAADLLASMGCRAEVVLPRLAAALSRNIYGDAGRNINYSDTRSLAEFLAALPGHPERWSDEDRWVNALRGRPAGDFVWAVYADWLADRGDPREEYVRVCHALAQGPESGADELEARRAAWLAAHGAGWERVYEAIRTPPDAEPEE